MPGASAAKEMVFTARRVSAARALELGIVGTVVDAGKAEDEALATAQDIAARGPLAVRLAKEAIDTGIQVRRPRSQRSRSESRRAFVVEQARGDSAIRRASVFVFPL